MQAIEFETVLKNGAVTIPAEYLAQWEGKVIRVLLLDKTSSVEAEHSLLEGSVLFEADLLTPTGEQWDADS